MKSKRIAAFLICLSLLVFNAGGVTAFSAEGGSKEILISSEEGFIEEAEKSGDGLYTSGKVFKLTKDLNFTGRDMVPFKTLSGVFDGQSHRIRGLNYSGKLSLFGPFCLVNETGVIKDLSVEADIFPSEDMTNIGGIAGINRGRIEGCSFAGRVIGKEATGGIAGRNMSEGRIKNCRNEGLILGMRRTGGIAGFNEGLIENCENRGNVNSLSKTAWELQDKREKELAGENEDESGSNENIDRLVPDTLDIAYDDLLSLFINEQEVHFTGGIAGVNSGTLKNDHNKAIIGYKHLGYKTGGISGYERGIISGCENSGDIFGRKNTGGISGQLEPFVKDDFHKDSFEKAISASDSLVTFVTALQSDLKGEDDSVQERIDAIRANADDLRSSIKGYKDYYRGKDDLMEADMRSHTTAIRNVLDGIDVNIKTGKANGAFTALDDDIKKIDALMGAAEKAAGNGVPLDMTNYIGSVRLISSDINDQISDLLTVADSAGKEYNSLRSSAHALRDSNNSLDDFLRNAYDSYKTDIRSTDDDLTVRIDKIADNMDALSDTLKGADSVVRSGMDNINDSLQLLTDMIDSGFEEARNELTKLRDTEDINSIYDDVSAFSDNTPGRGKIIDCRNEGNVNTDINGGGIAGMADTDIDLSSDFEVFSTGDVSLSHEKTKVALIEDCVNRGVITVKNDCAGGIAGNMDAGAVRKCENFGFVSSLEGDYAGGIVGKSGNLIIDSFSMSKVSGAAYVGGIAGYGNSVINNRTLSTIPPEVKDRAGAVAGDVKEDSGTVSGNIFVEDSLGAVNGLTFEDQAKAVSYDEFMSLSGIPKEASTMTVTFMSGGKTVDTIEVPYGSDVPYESFPVLPDDEGKFGVWDTAGLTNVRQNTVVNASYVSFVTTIASGEAFPVMLVSGRFYKGTGLVYVANDAPAFEREKIPEGYIDVISRYDFTIQLPEGAAKYPGKEETTLRVLSDDTDKNLSAGVMDQDGTIRAIPTARDGRYLVFQFDCSTGGGSFYILKAAPDKKIAAAIIIFAAAVMILLMIYLYKRRKPKASPSGGSCQAKPD